MHLKNVKKSATMKNILRILPLFFLLFVLSSRAEQVHYKSGKPEVKQTAAVCNAGANFRWLEINNVRTRINTGGDMWWDFEVAQYEIPKGSKKMSMFAAALWIGGIDANGQLKLAAQRFRQVGYDFTTGPLTIDGTAATSSEVCAAWDKIFYITRAEVDDFLAYKDDPGSFPNYQPPLSITEYPAHSLTQGHSHYQAPFFDVDEDLEYNYENGDYPYYDITNELCNTNLPTMEGNGILVDQVLKGDATLWWVFNDKGNIHSESKGNPIGLEIRAQAFGFSTNDEVNNMTFYSYEIINRSTYRLTQTYFSQWVDTDLGYAKDDYVGCDVMRGLGYCYNGKPVDGNGQAWAYGDKPPAIGVDFFQGPYLDPDGYDNPSFKGNGKLGPSFHSSCLIVQQDSTIQKMAIGSEGDSVNTMVVTAAINGVNFGNGIVDDERFGMRRFVYHNNGGPLAAISDPNVAIDYYNYLRGIWQDGSIMMYGGNGHPLAGATGPACYFMFPGLTDICDWGTLGMQPNGDKLWTEVTANNQPEDRRFMESAGPFILEPGAVNYITVGIPWAQAQSGGPEASVRLLQQVDDKCQQLFDNCFKVISGPNAPDLTIRELENKLVLYITNRKTSDAGNNYQEKFSEYDPRIQSPGNGVLWDSVYRFEGYQIFQLANATVSVADLKDNEKARLVFQCDVKNEVSRIVNFVYDQNLGGSVPVEEVDGANLGITHSVELTADAFTGAALVNHKQYYYLALAYAYNNYMEYNQTDPNALNGQKLPYLPGRKNIKVYTGIPHVSIGTTAMQSDYGDGVIITRIAGQGNGGRILDLSDESIAEILSKPMADSLNVIGSDNYPIAYNLTYKNDRGPIDVKVIDPLNIKSGNFTVKFDSMFVVRVPTGDNDTNMMINLWSLTDNETGIVYQSDTTTLLKNEQLFLDLGFSVSVEQILYPGPYMVSRNIEGTPVYEPMLDENGYLGSSITYQDSTKRWLNFLPDIDGLANLDWIKAGVATTDWQATAGKNFDPDGVYETVLNGTWTPYPFATSATAIGVAYGEVNERSREASRFTDISSVDVVFTADKTKWTRCAVLEVGRSNTEGGAKAFEIRKGRSVNIDGDTAVSNSDITKNSDFISPYGMGWFPGYAINVETGERLNIVFSEDSGLPEENGRDMIFNPTDQIINDSGNLVYGGRHFIYIMGHTYNKKSYVTAGSSPLPDDAFDNPAYDGGATFFKQVTMSRISALVKQATAYQMSNCMWTAIPFSTGEDWLNNDVTIKLRISKPYNRYHSTFIGGEKNDNNYWPMYKFSTSNVATLENDVAKAESDLDKINVVPNPYYAYSNYEVSQLDNRIKIVNLPQKCVITIYSTSGNLIRQFNKDESKTYVDWDLKNFAGIPIAGGIYIIHVKTDHGEKILKWFGSLRPIDLNSF
jgi:hypothetical protein